MKRLPKSFFEEERPVISAEESFKDIEPIMWNNEDVDKNIVILNDKQPVLIPEIENQLKS